MQRQPQTIKPPFAWAVGGWLLMAPYGIVGFWIAALIGYVVTEPWRLAGHDPTGWDVIRPFLGIWLWLFPLYQWVLAPRFGVWWRCYNWAIGQAVVGSLLLVWPAVAAIEHRIAWAWHAVNRIPFAAWNVIVIVAVVAAVVFVVVGIVSTPKRNRTHEKRQWLRAQVDWLRRH